MSSATTPPGSAHRPNLAGLPGWIPLLAVWCGGGAGGAVRYGIGSAWTHTAGTLPYATLTINVIGSALMGVLLAGRWTQATSWPLINRLVGVGFLGGFTTLSSYSLEAFELLQSGHSLLALSYLGATLIIGVVGAWAGWVLARRWWPPASLVEVEP